MPLKQEAPSGENDFQAAQRLHGLKGCGSGVRRPNSPCHCITRFSRESSHEVVGLRCPRALPECSSADFAASRRMWFVCFCFGVSGLNYENMGSQVQIKLLLSTTPASLSPLSTLSFPPPLTSCIMQGYLGRVETKIRLAVSDQDD